MDKNELRKLAEAAEGGRGWYQSEDLREMFEETGRKHYGADAPFIAAANPTTIIALLDEIGDKDSEIDRLKSELDKRRQFVNEMNEDLINLIDQYKVDMDTKDMKIECLVSALSDIATDKREHGDDDDALLIRCQYRAMTAVSAYEAKMKEVGDGSA